MIEAQYEDCTVEQKFNVKFGELEPKVEHAGMQILKLELNVQ